MRVAKYCQLPTSQREVFEPANNPGPRKATGLAAVTAPTSRTVASDSAGKDRAGRPAEPSRPGTKNADERDWSSVVLETTYGLDSRESVVARGGSAFYLTASANRRRDRRRRRFTDLALSGCASSRLVWLTGGLATERCLSSRASSRLLAAVNLPVTFAMLGTGKLLRFAGVRAICGSFSWRIRDVGRRRRKACDPSRSRPALTSPQALFARTRSP